MSRSYLLLAGFAIFAVIGCGTSNTDQASPELVENSEVSASEFQQRIKGDGLVLAKFGAPWCGPCREVDKELDKLEASNQGKLAVIRINVDEEPGLAEEYEVDAIPQSFLFRNGEVIQQWLGYKEASEFQESINDALATAK